MKNFGDRKPDNRKSDSKRAALEKIEEGQVLEGTVKNITEYGAFVDVGGIDGLLHVSNMSWDRVNHPRDVVNIGDTVTVKVLSVDKAQGRVSLGMKQLERESD